MASTPLHLQDNVDASKPKDMSPDIASNLIAERNVSPNSAESSTPSGTSSDAPPSTSSTTSPAVTSTPSALLDALQLELEPLGFECHPLLVGWYNSQVTPSFRLPYPSDTLAVVIISTPDMFERCFMPHVRRVGRDPASRRDPLDSCMRQVIGEVARRVHGAARVLHDCDLSATRRPLVLVQTAGHVSGAVRLYRREELKEDPWPDQRAMMGVCLHPKFGGWFALRAMVVLDGVQAPDLQQPQPPEILDTEQEKREVLEFFNWHWRDWRYREFGAPQQSYSALQREYFITPPGERQPIVDRIAGGEGASEQPSQETAAPTDT